MDVARARVVLKEIEKDPARSLIVIDPPRSETAAMADYHLQIAPGTDAWCLAALVAAIVQEQLIDRSWVVERTSGVELIETAFADISVARYSGICGIDEERLHAVARRIAADASVAVFEDLGMQMSVHSTLGSYLQRLILTLTGNFGREGTANAFSSLVSVAALSKGTAGSAKRAGPARSEPPAQKKSPVVGARVIAGLIPCNVVPEEILTDHPLRYRAMLVESGNPADSIADSQRMREALSALELLVVMNIAMTETARLAHYVLPSPSQFEKYEATFFNTEFPRNAFQLRHPVIAAPAGPLVEALGGVAAEDLAPLHDALKKGRPAFAMAFFAAMATNPVIARHWAYVLYRTLGPTLPGGAAAAAALWGASHLYVRNDREAAARAGFDRDPFSAGEKLFAALLESTPGVVFSVDDYAASWKRVGLPDGKIDLVIPELLEELGRIEREPLEVDPEYPLILSAGERRAETADSIYRDHDWRTKERAAALRVSLSDAAAIGLIGGGHAGLDAPRQRRCRRRDLDDDAARTHLAPKWLGYRLSPRRWHRRTGGRRAQRVTSSAARDFLTGTPWHEHVPARLQPTAALLAIA